MEIAKFKIQYEKHGYKDNDLPVRRTFSFLSEISKKPSKKLKRDGNFSFQVDVFEYSRGERTLTEGNTYFLFSCFLYFKKTQKVYMKSIHSSYNKHLQQAKS
jgi:hypothetical protein